MNNFVALLDLACGRASREEDPGRARTFQLILAALLSSLAFAAIWGLAAGSQSAGLAVSNLLKVPMVVLLAALTAIPPGLLAFKLCGASGRPSDLLLDFTIGVFAGTLVLAVVSPLVALYYHSSVWAGPLLGMGSALAAILVGSLIFLRGAFQKRPGVVLRKSVLILPVGIFLAMQIATLVQLIALASPILPEQTVFDRGVDQMVKR
jgi:hypothetical protein